MITEPGLPILTKPGSIGHGLLQRLPSLTIIYARHAKPLGVLGLVYQTLPHGTYKTIGALGWSTNVLPNFTNPYRRGPEPFIR
jgi:hypothetical protein